MLSLQGRRMLPPGPPPGGRQVKDAVVFAIGQRALLASPSEARGRVTLTDEAGTAPVVTLSAGTEVAIVAWRPRRGGGTRYRVVVSSDGTEGWVGVASLAPRPVVAQAPVRRAVLAAPVTSAAKSAAKPVGVVPRPLAAAKAKPAAATVAAPKVKPAAARKPKRKSR
jgi:hypothetical protein